MVEKKEGKLVNAQNRMKMGEEWNANAMVPFCTLVNKDNECSVVVAVLFFILGTIGFDCLATASEQNKTK